MNEMVLLLHEVHSGLKWAQMRLKNAESDTEKNVNKGFIQALQQVEAKILTLSGIDEEH